MGVLRSPEYVLLFASCRPTRSKSYADDSRHPQEAELRDGAIAEDRVFLAQWQFDAHSYWRSSGDRILNPEEYTALRNGSPRALDEVLRKSMSPTSAEHVQIAWELERGGLLPKEFMGLPTTNPGYAWVWDDVTRMRTFEHRTGAKGL